MKTLTAYWKFSAFKSIVIVGLTSYFLLSSPCALAQRDSLLVIQEGSFDTTTVERLDPRKALLYSAILPGLGQIYNGKYWKLPLVYGGFAVTISVVNFYQQYYKDFREELFVLLADPTITLPSGRNEKSLRYALDRARRNRDYYVIITGVWYILQLVDAHVDAYLQEFKINKEMKISLSPSVDQNMFIGRTTGLTLTLKF